MGVLRPFMRLCGSVIPTGRLVFAATSSAMEKTKKTKKTNCDRLLWRAEGGWSLTLVSENIFVVSAAPAAFGREPHETCRATVPGGAARF